MINDSKNVKKVTEVIKSQIKRWKCIRSFRVVIKTKKNTVRIQLREL